MAQMLCSVPNATTIQNMIRRPAVSRILNILSKPVFTILQTALNWPYISELLEKLAADHLLHVEIETNGSVSLAPFVNIPNRPSFTMDYKLSCSGMENAMDTDNFSLLTEKDTVKFVTGSLADCKRAVEIMKQFRLIGRCHLYFSPVFGSIDPADIVEFMKEQQLNGVNLQIQMHKVIWDPDRRGV